MVLQPKITAPPDVIQEYAIRINERSGRDRELKNLPESVESVLIEFVEDMLGYGWKEIQCGFVEEGEPSSFYMGLGRTECERKSAIATLSREREWRPDLFKALQKALRDVRSYKCVIHDGKTTWLPNDRKGKRRRYSNETAHDMSSGRDETIN